MANSVLEAIRLGLWDYEPEDLAGDNFHATGAMPGTADKLSVLAERVRQGLPLWHPADRQDCDEPATQFAEECGYTSNRDA